MSKSCEQLQHEFIEQITKYRDQHESWALRHEHLITHAVTLTFDIKKLWRMLQKSSDSRTLNHPEVVELLQGSMRYFKWKLDKSLYGNRRGRLFFVPILEGLRYGEKPHYHCLLGVSEDRSEVVESKIKSIWSECPFGGHHVVVEPYRSRGWVGYATKNAQFLNRESIDWMNVLLPSRPPVIAE